MRVLTDPAETGAATIALPEDVQAEAHDWPVDLFAERVWRIGRPVPEPEVLDAAAEVIRGDGKPVIISGGGVTYAEANDALRAFVEATGIPITETQAGQGLAAVRPPAEPGRGRRHRQPGGEPVRPAGRRGHRDRHPLLGFHHRVPDDLPEPGRQVHQHQRRLDRRRQARRAAGAGRREAHAGGADRRCWPATRPPPSTSRRRSQRAKAWDDEVVASLPLRLRRDARRASPRPRCSARSTRRWTPATWWSARPARCPATCTACGAPGTARATTSNTGTPAWATRSPAASASGWPHPSGTSSSPSATAPT